MSDANLASHEQLQRSLEDLSLPTGPAEVQAVLCGLICGGSEVAQELWLSELLPDGLDAANLTHKAFGEQLAALYQQTQEAFGSTEFDFDLLLPASQRPLIERAEELVDWCRGFNYGLGLSGCSLQGLSAEAREGLADLAEITRLDTSDLADSEEQEQQLMQLSEFVRVAVLLIREELAPPVPAGSA